MSGSGNNEPVTVGIVTTTVNVRQLSDGNPIGTVLGQSTSDLISFYGANPTAQPGTVPLVSRPVANLTIYASTQSPTIVAANTTGERAMTVTGVLATDMVLAVNKPTTQAGLLVGTARVSAANTIQVTLGNDTGSGITPTASETWDVITLGSNLTTTQALTPAAVAPNSTSEQYFAVAGTTIGQVVAVNKPTVQAGLMITNARVASPGQVAIQFQNLTAATITPTAAETYTFGTFSALSPATDAMTFRQTLTPAQVAANTTAEQTFTVIGLQAGTEVMVAKPSVTANLVIAGARVSALNTLAINYANNTAAAITPPVEVYQITAFSTPAPAAGSSTVIPVQRGDAKLAMITVGLL